MKFASASLPAGVVMKTRLYLTNRRALNVLTAALLAPGAASASPVEACLKPFIRTTAGSKPLFQWHSTQGQGGLAVEAPASSITCSPKGRIILLSKPSGDQSDPPREVFMMTVIDPVAGRSVLDSFAGRAWVSPDHRLVAYTPLVRRTWSCQRRSERKRGGGGGRRR